MTDRSEDFDYNDNNTKMCLLCMEDVHIHGYGIDGGVCFRGSPGYGSRFDFSSEGALAVYLCDDCLEKAAKDIAVQFQVSAVRSPHRPETLSRVWRSDLDECNQAAALRASFDQRRLWHCQQALDELRGDLLVRVRSQETVLHIAASLGPRHKLTLGEFEPMFRTFAAKLVPSVTEEEIESALSIMVKLIPGSD